MGLFDFLRSSSFDFQPDDLLFDNEYLIVGASYKCRKDPNRLRSSVINRMKPGKQVRIEEYSYRKRPAFMVVHPVSGLDLGVLSQGTADYLSSKFPNAIFRAVLTDRHGDSFHVRVCILKEDNPSFTK